MIEKIKESLLGLRNHATPTQVALAAVVLVELLDIYRASSAHVSLKATHLADGSCWVEGTWQYPAKPLDFSFRIRVDVEEDLLSMGLSRELYIEVEHRGHPIKLQLGFGQLGYLTTFTGGNR